MCVTCLLFLVCSSATKQGIPEFFKDESLERPKFASLTTPGSISHFWLSIPAHAAIASAIATKAVVAPCACTLTAIFC